jgi:hypothetical protein
MPAGQLDELVQRARILEELERRRSAALDALCRDPARQLDCDPQR